MEVAEWAGRVSYQFLLQVEGDPFMVAEFAGIWFGSQWGHGQWPRVPGELRRRDPDLGSLGYGL